MIFKNIAKKMTSLLMHSFRIIPIKKNKIVFSEYSARKYGDNPKYIAEEMVKEGLNFDCVFVLKDPKNTKVSDGIRKVKYNSIRYLYELSTAKFWVDNTRKQSFITKRPEQFYIQTWHGGVALKRIEKDVEASLDKEYVNTAIKDSKNINLLIASSDWGEKMMRRAFWYDGEIIKASSARLDPLFKKDKEKEDAIKKSLNIPLDKKILLYAPTFRKTNDREVYNIDFEALRRELNNKFNNEWVIVTKLHPNISNEAFKKDINIIDLTKYQDITDLYLVSDILITDYSSTMFDFSLQEKPVFLFCTDINEYVNDRNFYFDINNLPYSLATNNKELINNIKNYSETKYKKQLKEFKQNIGLIENGTGAKTICNIIKNVYDKA